MSDAAAVALADRLLKLYTPVVSDVLDKLGRRNQCLPAEILPLAAETLFAGVARPVRTVPAREVAPAEPYKGLFAAVDSLGEGDIFVASRCEFAFWGELLSTAAVRKKARGAVIDGYARDSAKIRAAGFPVCCRGTHPADCLGRVDAEAHDVPVEVGGVTVRPGDLILADQDGIVVVPLDAAEEAISLAEEKVGGENLVRKALAGGMTVTEAYRTYGVM